LAGFQVTTIGRFWVTAEGQSLTSVAAMECVVASWSERARLDPAGEFVK
jgi:hypothetical protein